MKIELKNIKHSAFASQETHCYEATLYIDGKRVAIVGNDGHGGCDYQHRINESQTMSDIYQQIEAANHWLAENRDPAFIGSDGEPYPVDVEMECCTLVNEWLAAKEVKKILNRISYIKYSDNGKAGLYQLPAKFKPTAERLAEVQNCKWWDADHYTMISGLDADKARTKLISAGVL